LSRLLNDPRQDIRDRVVWAYRNVHDEKVATQLVDATALQALSPRESLLALRVIGGGVGDDAAPGLISLVNSSDVAVAGAATRALFLVASRRLNSSFWFGYTREKVPGLVDDTDLVQITQWIDHDSAARGLRYFGVVSAMSMPRESVCRTALNNISHNADIALRLLALRALAAHGCVPDLDILESAYRLMLFDDRMTMRLAEDVLRNRDDADELLADMIHRADGAKLESSVWLASVYGGQQSAAELVALVGHENPDVRVAAVWALGRTGSINHADHLELARLDPDADVSEMADRAMGMLHRRLN
jgi:HEAT repeat protein